MSPTLRRVSGALVLAASVVALPACDSDPVVDDYDGPLLEAEANLGQWTYIDVEGSKCRDGSDVGIGVRLQEGAENLVIYLEGGGACFNGATCACNPPSFSESNFTAVAAARGDAGIFSTGDDNPVGDWNMVYVPYCTGDVHGGSNPAATVPGVSGTQQFVGHQNVERALALLDDYYADDPDRVLLTGASAGGFGTLLNFPSVADTFDGSDLTLLDDSGPIFFADDVFSPQLGGGFSALYNFPATLPAATALFQPDGLQTIYAYLDSEYPDATFGLSSYLQDQTIRGFFSFGQPDFDITGAEYAAGLRDVRDRLPDSWGTYYASGAAHTFIGGPAYFQTSAGVSLNDWLADLLDGDAANVDPDVSARIAAR